MGGLKETTMMVRMQQYAQAIQECKSSGLTIAKWCAENGIGVKTYYYRQRKVRKVRLEMTEDKLPALTETASTEFAKVPVTMVARPGDKPATVVHVNGTNVEYTKMPGSIQYKIASRR